MVKRKKGQKDKQWSTKHTHKTKDRVQFTCEGTTHNDENMVTELY